MTARADNVHRTLKIKMLSPYSSIIDKSTAVKSLVPEADCTISEGADGAFEILEWVGPAGQEPTNSEVEAEFIRLQGLWTANQYARDRRDEYPDIGVQLNKIYDDGIDKWKTEMVDPVKAKIAKP